MSFLISQLGNPISSEKEDGFQAFLSYRRPHFGLLDDLLKVAYGNNASIAEYQTTFWLALPSWFRKLSIVPPGSIPGRAAYHSYIAMVNFRIKIDVSQTKFSKFSEQCRKAATQLNVLKIRSYIGFEERKVLVQSFCLFKFQLLSFSVAFLFIKI